MRAKMKIAIDLLWLRPNKVGGPEFYIRNFLDGFMESDMDFEFVLLLSKDNCDTFEKYMADRRFGKIVANVYSINIGKRIIWQNLNQNRLLRKNGIKNCFTPAYCRPILNGGLTYINVIHDLQAYHYPQFHPAYEVWYTKLCWMASFRNSRKLIATSQWVKNDIVKTYHVNPKRIQVIKISISVEQGEQNFQELKGKYGIEDGEFFYAVSQMIPHKNFDTLVRVMDKIVHSGIDLPKKLLISGISGNASDTVNKLIKQKGLQQHIILTGFISSAQRNALYKHCRAFLYPSIFEGFGMPPIEAMAYGSTVITTRCTSIPEVTQNRANYVQDPYNADEWIQVMQDAENNSCLLDLSPYDKVTIAEKYNKVFNRYFR